MTKEKGLAKLDTSTLTLEQVPDLLAQVNEKIAQIQDDSKGVSSVGSGEIPGIGSISEMGIPELISVRASIRKQAEAFDAEVILLKNEGVHITKNDAVKKINGFSIDAWITSISSQIRITGQKDLLSKLKVTRNKLTKYVTKEQQLRSDMTDIAELLS